MSASSAPRILTTTGYPERREWVRRVQVLQGRSWANLTRRLIAEAPRYDAVVLWGSHRSEQAAAFALSRVRRRVPVILQSTTWKTGDNAADRLASRAIVRLLAGPSTHFCVLTRAELESFPRTWGVAPGRVHLTPFYYGLSEAELAAPTAADGSVFAGGDSLRDYRPLIEAATGVDARVRIAALNPPPVPRSSLASNVEFGPLPSDQYVAAMRRASLVVVALAGGTERSAGQHNYLNAMALGKLLVVTDATGVSDYVEHRRTGLVVPPGDPRALAGELRWALDPANANEARAIAERGRRTALERFSPDRYVQRLLGVVKDVARTRPR